MQITERLFLLNSVKVFGIQKEADSAMEPAPLLERNKRNAIMQYYISLRYLPLSSPLVIFTARPSSTSRFNLLQMLPVLPS